MLSPDGKFWLCDHPGCVAKITNHKWGKMKPGANWFFSRRTDEAWCPEHIPDWVVEWRAKKKD